MLALTDGERIALITGLFLVVVAIVPGIGWLLRRIIISTSDAVMSRNTDEHIVNKQGIDLIVDKVDGLSNRLLTIERKVDRNHRVTTSHLEWHLADQHQEQAS